MIVEGYAALFGVVDQMADVVRAGAFARARAPLPMYVEHEQRLRAGEWTDVREDARGLFVRGEIRDDLPGAARAKRMIARGVDGLCRNAAARPWAPARVRASRGASGDVAISWIRCARCGGDFWGPGEVPVGELTETYQLDILSGSLVKRSVTVTSPAYTYSAANQIVDFGAPPASLHLRFAQLGSSGAPGLNTELTITL